MSARKCSGCAKFFSVKLSACPDCGVLYAPPAKLSAKLPARVFDQNAPRIAPPKPCIANACPLAGTFNPIIYGDGHPWYCFIHSDLPAADWPRATEAIRRALPDARPLDDRAFRNAIRNAVSPALLQLTVREPGADDA